METLMLIWVWCAIIFSCGLLLAGLLELCGLRKGLWIITFPSYTAMLIFGVLTVLAIMNKLLVFTIS